MADFINETTVMKFYIERIDSDSISFLKGRDALKKQIRDLTEGLMKAGTMNEKIIVAVNLWKKLFEASMSFISPDKRGYDRIFNFFDSYVEFEELIFASDSFYRDHTLHCIWVYFLGEYVANRKEFEPLFIDQKMSLLTLDAFTKLYPNDLSYSNLFKTLIKANELEEAARCVSALTHDLGYPLKKIEKINKSIKKVLPFFAVNNFDDFKFEYTNTQQEFTENFIDFISRELNVNMHITDDETCTQELLDRANGITQSFYKTDSSGNILSIDEKALKNISQEDRDFLHGFAKIKIHFTKNMATQNSYLNDFENYQHGIMSAFLLMKNLPVFQNVSYDKQKNSLSTTDSNDTPAYVTLTLGNILGSISTHTCENFKFTSIQPETYLTLIDELEEFSRISRASQNREYVKEFCNSAINMTEDGWLDIRFVFDNPDLDNLKPEISFKGRCKRFLTLFNIPHMSPNLKIRVTIKGELPWDQNEYVLEVAQKHADIRINGESKDIPSYLKSTQFYSKEEYSLVKKITSL